MGLNHPQNRDLSSNRSKTRMLNVEAGIPALTEVEELWSIRWTDERDKTGRCNICDFSMKFRSSWNQAIFLEFQILKTILYSSGRAWVWPCTHIAILEAQGFVDLDWYWIQIQSG